VNGLLPRIPSSIGGDGARELAPERMLPWAYCWSTMSPRWLAKRYADGAAIDSGFPDEIGSVDLTRNAAGPVARANLATMGGAAVETGGSQVLRTAAAALSVSLPYSYVAAIRFAGNVAGGGTYLGGATSSEGGLLGVFNALTELAGGSGVGTSQATNGQAFVVVTWDVTATTDTVYVGTTSVGAGSCGNATPTAASIGGYRDASSLVNTQCSFWGITSGQLASAHARWPLLVTRLRRGL
jgi:hypothetical protein